MTRGKKNPFEKYRNPDKRCDYPFTPDALGYCWSYAHFVDMLNRDPSGMMFKKDAPGMMAAVCKGCDLWKGEPMTPEPQASKGEKENG